MFTAGSYLIVFSNRAFISFDFNGSEIDRGR